MTKKNREDLQSTINAELADNTTGNIDASDSRDNMIDITDSSVFFQDIEGLLYSGASFVLNPVNDLKVTVNASDSTKFDISPGKLIFSDSFTDPTSPTTTIVNFPGATALTVNALLTEAFTLVYINKSGSVVQTTLRQPSSFSRENVVIGLISHSGGVISSINDTLDVSAANSLMSFNDISVGMGAVNTPFGGRNVVFGNAGTLGLNKTDGEWLYHGINARNDLKNPNVLSSAAINYGSIFIGWRTTDDPDGKLIIQQDIPAGVFDDNTAVQADALPQGILSNNSWTNHRVFMVISSNALAVQIGQSTYASKEAARSAVSAESFDLLPLYRGVTPIATLTMRGGAADLGLDADREIRQAIPPRATHQ